MVINSSMSYSWMNLVLLRQLLAVLCSLSKLELL